MKTFIITLLTTLWALTFIGCGGSTSGTSTRTPSQEAKKSVELLFDDLVEMVKVEKISPTFSEDKAKQISLITDQVKDNLKTQYVFHIKKECPKAEDITGLKAHIKCRKDEFGKGRIQKLEGDELNKFVNKRCAYLEAEISIRCLNVIDKGLIGFWEKVEAEAEKQEAKKSVELLFDDLVSLWKTKYLYMLPGIVRPQYLSAIDKLKDDTKQTYVAEIKKNCPEVADINILKADAKCRRDGYVEGEGKSLSDGDEIEAFVEKKCGDPKKGVKKICYEAIEKVSKDFEDKKNAAFKLIP